MPGFDLDLFALRRKPLSTLSGQERLFLLQEDERLRQAGRATPFEGAGLPLEASAATSGAGLNLGQGAESDLSADPLLGESQPPGLDFLGLLKAGASGFDFKTAAAYGLAGLADIFTNIENRRRGSPERGSSLKTLMSLAGQKELLDLRKAQGKREEKRVGLEEQRVGVEKQRLASQESLQRFTVEGALMERAYKMAATIDPTNANVEAAVRQLVQQGEKAGVEVDPTLIRGMFTYRDVISKNLPEEYLPYIPADSDLRREMLVAEKKGEGEVDKLAKRLATLAQGRAFASAQTKLSQALPELLRKYGDQPVPFRDILESPFLTPGERRSLLEAPLAEKLLTTIGVESASIAAARVKARATEKPPAQIRTEAKERRGGELEAERLEGGTSEEFKALDKDVKTYLLGKGIKQPTPKQIAEADLIVKQGENEAKIASTLRGRAVKEMNARAGRAQGKAYKADVLFENLPDADVKLLAVGDENVIAALLRNVLGGGGSSGGTPTTLKNGKSREQNIADLMARGLSRDQAAAEVERKIKAGQL